VVCLQTERLGPVGEVDRVARAVGDGGVDRVGVARSIGVHVVPELFGNVREQRGKQLQEPPVCRPERVRRGVVLALFDDLEVVVTERVPEEAPEFVAGLRERAILEEPSESLDSVVELGEQPAVELSEVFVGRRIRVRLRRQRLDELRGVPQLADQLLARARRSFSLNGKSSPTAVPAAQ